MFEEDTGAIVEGEPSVLEKIKSVQSTSTTPKPDVNSFHLIYSTLEKDEKENGDVAMADPEDGGAHILLSPPCINIREEDERQLIQIRLDIAGKKSVWIESG